jgi:hypothetical protein
MQVLILFIIFLGAKTITMENLLRFVIDYMEHIVILKELQDMDINLVNQNKKYL